VLAEYDKNQGFNGVRGKFSGLVDGCEAIGVMVRVHGVNAWLSGLGGTVSKFDPGEFDSPGLR